jgi:hypothetical protein
MRNVSNVREAECHDGGAHIGQEHAPQPRIEGCMQGGEEFAMSSYLKSRLNIPIPMCDSTPIIPCASRASTGLCGGPRATAVPTATRSRKARSAARAAFPSHAPSGIADGKHCNATAAVPSNRCKPPRRLRSSPPWLRAGLSIPVIFCNEFRPALDSHHWASGQVCRCI